MSNSFKTCILGMCFMFNFTTYADELASGNWSGSVTMPEKKQRPATFKVHNSGEGHYKIMMLYNDRPYSFEDIEFEEDQLTFTIDTGTVYSCILAWQEKDKLTGVCQSKQSDETTRTISLELLPPEPSDPDDIEDEGAPPKKILDQDMS